MGVINTIISSSDDLLKPSKKSYAGCRLEVTILNVDKLRKKNKLLESEKRALEIELSDKENCDEVVIIDNKIKKLGRLTTNQVKDIFDDIGFNVDVIFSKPHESNFSAVMNIGGYTVPMWVKFVRMVCKVFPSKEKMLLTKLSPGKDRLHVRVFESNDGSWMIIAHTDHNWMSLNFHRILKAHTGNGSGDYVTGARMIYELLKRFNIHLVNNSIFPTDEVLKTLNWAYYQSVADKLKMSLG